MVSGFFFAFRFVSSRIVLFCPPPFYLSSNFPMTLAVGLIWDSNLQPQPEISMATRFKNGL
ncbi:MAG: hypothetical protein D3924_02790 [Candidatus Electrothrix sp. AR4]|nr:hypothetical protein [Candidatus Electrothrix sp. AR4]